MALFFLLPSEVVGDTDGMEIRGLFRQFHVAFLLRDIDIAEVAVLETIVEIQRTAFRYAPVDAGLRADMTDILMAVTLLIGWYIERILQLAPYIGFHIRFLQDIEVRSDKSAPIRLRSNQLTLFFSSTFTLSVRISQSARSRRWIFA